MPVNTTVTRDVTITVDAGYRTELASGSGHQRAVRLQLRHLRRRRRLHRPRHLHRQAALHADQRRRASSGTHQRLPVPRRRRHLHPDHLHRQRPRDQQRVGASPNPVEFGDVPMNTTVTRDVTITVDAGYRTELASGSGINAPFGFSFDTCGAGGGFTGPGTCTVKQRFTPDRGRQLERDAPTSSSAPSAAAPASRSPTPSPGTRRSATQSASPNPVEFGDVPVNTTVTRDVTITVDAGYRTELASGSGHQCAVRLQLRHLRRRRRLHRPRHLHRQAALHADQRRRARAGRPTSSSAPSPAAPASRSPTPSPAAGSATPAPARTRSSSATCPIGHDRDA